MTAIALVQACMGSARLPGKVMLPLRGTSMVVQVCWRASRIPGLDKVVLCTTTEPEDQPLADLFWRHLNPERFSLFRAPSPDDVLARFALAALQYPAETYLRITADCPLLDPWLAGRWLAMHEGHGKSLTYSTPNLGWLDGLDIEIFSRKLLFEALAGAETVEDLEHVTGWMRRSNSTTRIGIAAHDEPTAAFAALPEPYRKWSVDTQEEYERVAAIYEQLSEGAYTWRDTCAAIGRINDPR